jgi:hypothetical protein
MNRTAEKTKRYTGQEEQELKYLTNLVEKKN